MGEPLSLSPARRESRRWRTSNRDGCQTRSQPVSRVRPGGCATSIHQAVSGDRAPGAFPLCSRRLRRATQRGRFAARERRRGSAWVGRVPGRCALPCHAGQDGAGWSCVPVGGRPVAHATVRSPLSLSAEASRRDPGLPEVIALIAACPRSPQLRCYLSTYSLRVCYNLAALSLHLQPTSTEHTSNTVQARPFSAIQGLAAPCSREPPFTQSRSRHNVTSSAWHPSHVTPVSPTPTLAAPSKRRLRPR